MNIAKKVIISACTLSIMFGGIGYHMANNYSNLDGGATAATSYGVTYSLNEGPKPFAIT